MTGCWRTGKVLLTVVPGDGSGHKGGKDGSPSLIDEIVRGRPADAGRALQAEIDAYTPWPPSETKTAAAGWSAMGITSPGRRPASAGTVTLPDTKVIFDLG